MRIETFFENFELLTDAPNAIAKLREIVLQLAVQGKLVSQDVDDQHASVLLAKIKAEKELIAKKKLRQIELDFELDFQNEEFKQLDKLPKSWCWTNLGTVGCINPRNDLPDNLEVAFIPMNLVPQKYGDLVQWEIRQWGEIKKGFTHFSEGDVALAKITPCFQNGKSCVMQGLKNKAGAGTTELHIFKPIKNLTCSEYILIYLKSPKFISDAIPIMTGTAGQKRVPNSYVSANPFPMPPLAEQKRIVAKVDRLLSFCNQIEVRQQKRQESIVRMNESAIAQLLCSQNPDEFYQRWQRICDNFDLLYSIPETIPNLRQAILQLAVQGKLVRQDPNDEPASILLERIKTDKLRLAAEGLIRKFEPLPAVATDNAPFELPKGWTWARFPELGEFGRGKSKHRPRNDLKLYEEGNYPLVQTGDVARSNGLITTYTGLYNDVGLAQSRLWFKGTLCITIAANIADSGILSFDACIPDSVVGFVPSKELGDAPYFEYFMRTAKEHLQDYAPSTAQKNINLAILEKVLIPLPPLAEQKRIVAKVDRLMSLCDTLEAKLKEARSHSETLMEVAAKQVLVA